MSTWEECLGPEAQWARESLERRMRYAAPLPIQSVVIPTVARAVQSQLPLDVSLTAPTGSGKTLCYLVPLLRLLTSLKKGLNDTRLRALVLVPTRALGAQVFSELRQLAAGSSIVAASLCGGDGAGSSAASSSSSPASPSTALVRHVRVVSAAALVEDAAADGLCRDEVWSFACVDVLVATPQRLLRHLEEHTRDLSLAFLRLLVVDEADQVLSGGFAGAVAKVAERHAAECAHRAALVALQQRQLAREALGLIQAGADSLFPSHGEDESAAYLAAGVTAGVQPDALPAAPLHKILCSATLSSRTARTAEVRLQNCHYIVLNSDGADLSGQEGRAVPVRENNNSGGKRGKKQEQGDGAATQVVKASFALPPNLHEHVVFVENRYRHAVLLKLVRELYDVIEGKTGANKEEDEENGNDANTDETPYPPRDPTAGNTILVFCSSAEEARVMGNFLAAAGLPRVVEFTTLATESERRAALLATTTSNDSNSNSSDGGRHKGGAAGAALPRCVVASDAMMRGIDIPQVGHVVMYHPPENLTQYVHRAGRTARALRPGHVHLLLSKNGPSGTQADGEVAKHQRLSAAITKATPTRYERHFFVFLATPQRPPNKKELERERRKRLEEEKQRRKEKEKEKAAKREARRLRRAEGQTAEAQAEEEEGSAPAAAADDDDDDGSRRDKSASDADERGDDDSDKGSAKGEREEASHVPSDPTPEAEGKEEVDEELAATVEDSAEWWIREAGKYLQESQAQLAKKWASAMDQMRRRRADNGNNNSNSNKDSRGTASAATSDAATSAARQLQHNSGSSSSSGGGNGGAAAAAGHGAHSKRNESSKGNSNSSKHRGEKRQRGNSSSAARASKAPRHEK